MKTWESLDGMIIVNIIIICIITFAHKKETHYVPLNE